MRFTSIMVALMALPTALLAGEGLKTNYYEAAVNSAPDPTINYRKWTTSRDGETILEREERDLTRNGKWAQVDQTIMFKGKKVLLLLSIEGRRSAIYYPEAKVKIVHADTDGDGFQERISLLDEKDRTLDILLIDKTGRATPIPDQELASWQKTMKGFSEAMKDF